jgi:hypothetical protein
MSNLYTRSLGPIFAEGKLGNIASIHRDFEFLSATFFASRSMFPQIMSLGSPIDFRHWQPEYHCASNLKSHL